VNAPALRQLLAEAPRIEENPNALAATVEQPRRDVEPTNASFT
jgi:hypothetical protein